MIYTRRKKIAIRIALAFAFLAASWAVGMQTSAELKTFMDIWTALVSMALLFAACLTAAMVPSP
jgi:hypothetical protein